MSNATYYQRNRDVILDRAKDYYKNNKERLREQAKDRYRNLSKEDKIKKREYGKTDTMICLKKKTETKRKPKILSRGKNVSI